jgi:hypothetical protein
MISTKIVIAAVPYVNTPRPLAAPAVLKSALSKHGFDCVALDLNVDIENKIANHKFKFKFVNFFKNQTIAEEIVDELALMIDHCVEEILSHAPTIVGLSLFCHSCQNFTTWLCASIRQRNPSIKIVIGGPGLQVQSGAMLFDYPTKLKRLGLIDDFISGDGENSIVEYVKGNYDYPGINSANWAPVNNLNDLPIPDYSDYKWYRYKQQAIPIIDSRGCVQSCEFCDVIAYWKKFQFLTAENIFSQMMYLMKKYQFNKFDFRSSISNGNLKEFKKLIKLLSDHNNNKNHFPAEKIIWDGSFIIRGAEQHNEEFWQLLKDSNPDRLFVGVESVVERVRIGLGKNFTNADLDHFLKMSQKYQIPVNLLCISGYPTETDEEYELSKQWFYAHKDYADNSVAEVQLTSIGILPGTQLKDKVDNGEFSNLKYKKVNKYQELCQSITDSGFTLSAYNLMDRPDQT